MRARKNSPNRRLTLQERLKPQWTLDYHRKLWVFFSVFYQYYPTLLQYCNEYGHANKPYCRCCCCCILSAAW